MDVRIEGLHEQALVRLMERNGEKTSIGMLRLLIRDEARKLGIWPDFPEEDRAIVVKANSRTAFEVA